MPELTPQQRQQLDSNIKAMLNNGATQDDVIKYASDFNAKYGQQVKKKRSYLRRNIEAFGWWCKQNVVAFGVWWRGWEFCWPVRRRN